MFPVDTLGMYILLDPQKLMTVSNCFPDPFHYKSDPNVIIDIIKYNKEYIYCYGTVQNLDSHSVQKGVEHFL